jgi:hypothetical protein
MTDVAVTLLGPDQTLDARGAVRCKRMDVDSEGDSRGQAQGRDLADPGTVKSNLLSQR